MIGCWCPDSRFAFQPQVHQTHRAHGMQGIIFADVIGATNNRKEKGAGISLIHIESLSIRVK